MTVTGAVHTSLKFIYQNLRPISTLAALLVIIQYKIPLLCHACEEPNRAAALLFRCAGGTGAGTKSCRIASAATSFYGDVNDAYAKSGVFVRESFLFMTETLPTEVREAFWMIVSKIRDLALDLMDRALKLKEFLLTKIEQILATLKDTVLKSREQLMEKVVRPLMETALRYLVDPLRSIIMQLLSFKALVLETLTSIIQKSTGVVYDGSQAVFGGIDTAFEAVPKAINETMRALVAAINGLKDTIINSAQSSVNTVVSGLNGTANGMEAAVNTVTREMVSKLSSATNGVVGSAENSVNAMIRELNDGLRTTIGGLNSAMGGITGGINGSLNGVRGAVNSAMSAVINPTNSIIGALDGIRNANIDIKVAKIRPFGFIPSIPRANAPSIDIPNVPTFRIGDARIKEVDFPDVVVPGIASVNIPDVPSVRLPAVKDVPGVKEVPSPGFKVGDQVAQVAGIVAGKVGEIVDKAMQPLNVLIATVIQAYHSMVAGLGLWMRAAAETVRDELWNIYTLSLQGLSTLFKIVKEQVVERLAGYFRVAYAEVRKVVQLIVSKSGEFLHKAVVEMKKLFSGVLTVVTKAFKTVATGTLGILYFSFGVSVDNLTPMIDLPVTVKTNTVLGIAAYFALGQYKDLLFSKGTVYLLAGVGLVGGVGAGMHGLRALRESRVKAALGGAVVAPPRRSV